MLKFLTLLLAFAAPIAQADTNTWSGSTVKWFPSGLKSAGVCKLDANGVMTSGTVDLASNITGVLPLANGGTNKNMTAVNGGLVYSDADSLEVTSAGTSGQAVVSGGAGAPTFFAPTVGSVIFAGTSGILDEENSVLFYDKTNNRLGIGTTVPSGTLDVTNTADSIRGNIVLWGQGKAANSEWIIYDSPVGDVSLYNPNQAVYGWSCRATGGCAIGTYALGSGNQMLGIKNNAGEEAKHTLVVQNVPSQTGDAFRHFASDATTVLSKVDVAGAATFANIIDSGLTADTVPYANSSKQLTSSAVTPTELGYVSGVTSYVQTQLDAKEVPLTFGDGLTRTTNDVDCDTASGSVFGCLSSTDWTTFNGKQAAGNYITALTGDVTASGPGSAAATLATVNSDVGSFTNANITVNAKGLITAASSGSSGGGIPAFTTFTGDDTVATSDEENLLCNCASACEITLYAADNASRKAHTWKNIGASTCTILGDTGDTFDGESSIILPAGGIPQSAITTKPNGASAWYIY